MWATLCRRFFPFVFSDGDDDVELYVLGCWLPYQGQTDQCWSTVQCCFTSTETIRLIRTGSPGRPPRLWHSSWTLSFLCSLRYFMQATDDWCFIRFKVGLHVGYVTEKESGASSARRIIQSLCFVILNLKLADPIQTQSLDTSTSFGAARTVRVWHNCCSPALVFYCSGSVGLTGVGQFLAHTHHQIKHNSLAKQKCLQWQAPDIQNKKQKKMNTSWGKKISKQITQHCWCCCADTNSSRDSQCMSGPSHPPHAIPPPPFHPQWQAPDIQNKKQKKMNTSTDLEVKIK